MPPKRDAVVKDAFPEGLQRGDIVFAKIFGFPWWPSIVRGVRHAYEAEAPTVRVRFSADGTNYHATPSTLERLTDKPEWADVKNIKFKSPTIRKKWEAAMAEAQAYSRDAETEWSDEEEAKEEEGLKKTAESWLAEGHEWLHRRVARPFGKTKVFLGKITKWIPADPAEGDGPLFHVVHDDGDVEDLEEYEVAAPHPLLTHSSLLTADSSLLTTHYSLLTTHDLLLTTYYYCYSFEVTAALKCYALQPEAKKVRSSTRKLLPLPTTLLAVLVLAVLALVLLAAAVSGWVARARRSVSFSVLSSLSILFFLFY